MTSTIIWHEGDCITMKERKREKQKYFIVKTQQILVSYQIPGQNLELIKWRFQHYEPQLLEGWMCHLEQRETERR